VTPAAIAKVVHYPLRVRLSDVITPDVINCVIAGDLLADLDPPDTRLAEAIQDFDRDQRLLHAWMAPRHSGRAQ
jgi:hypothetical protein